MNLKSLKLLLFGCCNGVREFCEQRRRLPNEMFDIFAALGFISLCINPLIYAVRYEAFRKSLRIMLGLEYA